MARAALPETEFLCCSSWAQGQWRSSLLDFSHLSLLPSQKNPLCLTPSLTLPILSWFQGNSGTFQEFFCFTKGIMEPSLSMLIPDHRRFTVQDFRYKTFTCRIVKNMGILKQREVTMDSETGIGGNVYLEDGSVPGTCGPNMLEETLSGFHEIGDGMAEIPDWSKEQYDCLLKVKLNDPSRGALPTDHSQWRLL